MRLARSELLSEVQLQATGEWLRLSSAYTFTIALSRYVLLQLLLAATLLLSDYVLSWSQCTYELFLGFAGL